MKRKEGGGGQASLALGFVFSSWNIVMTLNSFLSILTGRNKLNYL